VTSFSTERGYALDVMTGVSVAGLALVAVVELYIRVYDNRQKRLEELDRRRTELFANVSHEMKTPLTVVSVHIQRAEALFGLARGGSTLNAETRGKIRESFTLARDEIMRMSRLVDSALKLSSLRDGGGRRGPLDMGAILRASAELYRGLIESGGNVLTEDIPDGLPPVFGSADEMAQVISNLLSNANSHTRGGEIRVSAASEGAALAVTVWDNGAGISPDILPRAFDRGVTDGGGNGLGLSICRQIVASHGGEIAIDGEPGRGARVRFTLPLYSGEEGGAA
jgi:signal transduction histidine kinase